jgi:hypothetical protein
VNYEKVVIQTSAPIIKMTSKNNNYDSNSSSVLIIFLSQSLAFYLSQIDSLLVENVQTKEEIMKQITTHRKKYK